jgi:hypothetical protein
MKTLHKIALVPNPRKIYISVLHHSAGSTETAEVSANGEKPQIKTVSKPNPEEIQAHLENVMQHMNSAVTHIC